MEKKFKSSNFGLRLLRIPPKLHSHYRANTKYFAQKQKYASKFHFFCQNICVFEFFVVILHDFSRYARERNIINKLKNYNLLQW